jgi:hypothetical protein
MQSYHFIILMRVILLVAAVSEMISGQWSLVFVCLATFVLTLSPERFARWLGIRLPPSFLLAIVFFAFGTLFLGEVFDFYGRYWWWDIALHFGSAMGFGLLGFLFIFMLFEGDRYAAPPFAIAVLSFAVAIAIGTLWEVFEFGMDTIFGFNMQKSGLVDTMGDLIVDVVGAAIAAVSGYWYLRGPNGTGLGLIDQFVTLNKRLYRKFRIRRR